MTLTWTALDSMRSPLLHRRVPLRRWPWLPRPCQTVLQRAPQSPPQTPTMISSCWGSARRSHRQLHRLPQQPARGPLPPLPALQSRTRSRLLSGDAAAAAVTRAMMMAKTAPMRRRRHRRNPSRHPTPTLTTASVTRGSSRTRRSRSWRKHVSPERPCFCTSQHFPNRDVSAHSRTYTGTERATRRVLGHVDACTKDRFQSDEPHSSLGTRTQALFLCRPQHLLNGLARGRRADVSPLHWDVVLQR